MPNTATYGHFEVVFQHMPRASRIHPRPDIDEIDASVLTMPVVGRGLLGPRFEDQLKPEGTLIVFLRHLGCSFCSEMIRDLRAAALQRRDFPDVQFVHQGSILDGDALFARAWPEARAIADPRKRLYGAFRVERGSWLQLFGPAVIVRGAIALAKGNLVKPPIGDPFTMPGMFFVRNRRIAWQRAFGHIGDHPNFLALPEAIASSQQRA